MAEVPAPAGALARHRLFGYTLESDFAFARALPPAADTADLRLTRAARDARAHKLDDLEPIYRSPPRRDGESVSTLYRRDGSEILRFDGRVDFVLEKSRIEYHAEVTGLDWLVELRFLGPVMSYWMERRGLLCLHGSAVAFGDRAVALVGGGGAGKTTLAAALLRAGRDLVTDDIAALEERAGGFAVRPGYPEMRMWPDTAGRFVEHWRELPLAHPELDKRRVPLAGAALGRFRDQPLPLAAAYLLERHPAGGGPARIEAVAPRPALIELIGRSFSPHLVEAAGLQPERLERLARLVAQIPVRRLSYPAGHRRLEAVLDALSGDLGSLP